MPKNYSANLKKNHHSVNANETALVLLEIYHPDLAIPVRVVNDNQDLVSNGDTYIAMAFRVTMPDDREQGLPQAQLSIDNIGRELTDWLETSNGGEGATCRMMQVLRSDPDTIEWDVTLDFTDIVMTPLEVSGVLGYEDLLNRPGVVSQYRPDTHPGLF